MQVGNLINEIPYPASLLLGFGLHMLQNLDIRLVLLELALPIFGEFKHHGQGRKVEVVLRSRGTGTGED